MPYKFLLALIAIAASSQAAFLSYANASTVGNGTPIVYGNSLTLQSSLTTPTSISVRATAFEVDSSNIFQNARLRIYSNPAGMGVCTVAELADSNCTSSTTSTVVNGNTVNSPSEHQVDNLGRPEYVMFQFVNTTNNNILRSVTGLRVEIGSVAGDFDVSYWTANTNIISMQGLNVTSLPSSFSARTDVMTVNDSPATIAGLPTTLPAPGSVNMTSGLCSNGSGTCAFINILNTTQFNTLVFGARFGETNDGFKIRSISFDDSIGTSTNAVPEPGTYAMLGAGLIALAYFRRKKS